MQFFQFLAVSQALVFGLTHIDPKHRNHCTMKLNHIEQPCNKSFFYEAYNVQLLTEHYMYRWACCCITAVI